MTVLKERSEAPQPDEAARGLGLQAGVGRGSRCSWHFISELHLSHRGPLRHAHTHTHTLTGGQDKVSVSMPCSQEEPDFNILRWMCRLLTVGHFLFSSWFTRMWCFCDQHLMSGSSPLICISLTCKRMLCAGFYLILGPSADGTSLCK